MNGPVTPHSDYLTTDRLNGISQIAHKIDGTHGMALTADFLKLQADALYRPVGQTPCARVYFFGQ
ncbi:hypothetical protein VL23_02650 [Stenotrophomonas maltophilia]|uniref:Uncharacterized protein n=1 Tax=Stenotrophomonas maltophilia TaxID=40324 RepID=A0AB34TGM9_STEMA|nr:hypothetical protein VL23_02650 [Stenotrophomonas maltophilia]